MPGFVGGGAMMDRYFVRRLRDRLPVLRLVMTVNAEEFRGIPPGGALQRSVFMLRRPRGRWLLLWCVRTLQGRFTDLPGDWLPVLPESDVFSVPRLHEISRDTYLQLCGDEGRRLA